MNHSNHLENPTEGTDGLGLAPLADFFSDEASGSQEYQNIGQRQEQHAQERSLQRYRHDELLEQLDHAENASDQLQERLNATRAVERWVNAEIELLRDIGASGVILEQSTYLREAVGRLIASTPPSRYLLETLQLVASSLAGHIMSHSHNHADGNGHSHDEHDHSHDLEPALQSNLYSKIAFDDIITLNESISKSGAAIVKKEWSERESNSVVLTSDADEQLLMHVPFTGSVKLYSILVRTSGSPSAPKTLKLFRNREGLDFSTASELQPTQTLQIPQSNEVIEIPVNRAHFNGTTSIDLFFEDNHGDEEETEIGFLAFKGEWVALSREAVSIIYEAAANPRDHVLMQRLTSGGQQSLGQ